MPSLDVEAIRRVKEERDQQRAEAIAWCGQALSEFKVAAQELETRAYSSEFLLNHASRDYGQPVAGIWPLLRKGDPENVLIDVLHGASMLIDGRLHLQGKPSEELSVAAWIAARCGYKTDVMRELFTRALLGESWTERTALNAW